SALLPVAGILAEARREFRLLRRLVGRGALSCRLGDFAVELFVVRQASELIEEDHRLLRRNLELLPAGPADDFVVEPQDVVAELGELGVVGVVRAGRQTISLGPPDPADAVVVGAAALRTCEAAGPGFGLFGEECALVE